LKPLWTRCWLSTLRASTTAILRDVRNA
jgi:hypothetical protein